MNNTYRPSSTTTLFKVAEYGNTEMVEVNEVGESIEIIYKEHLQTIYTTYPPKKPQARVFKIIYSCVDGKWNKSEPIYGKIIPATQEYFEF